MLHGEQDTHVPAYMSTELYKVGTRSVQTDGPLRHLTLFRMLGCDQRRTAKTDDDTCGRDLLCTELVSDSEVREPRERGSGGKVFVGRVGG